MFFIGQKSCENDYKKIKGHLHPPKSTFPTSDRISESAIVISVAIRVQPCIHIENVFFKLDLVKLAQIGNGHLHPTKTTLPASHATYRDIR